MTIENALKKAVNILQKKKIATAHIDSELLLLYALEKSKISNFHNDRSWLYAHNDYDLKKNQEKKFFGLIERRKRFEPISYITNKKEFFGLEFHIDKNVLIPRPETEIIVEESIKKIADAIANKPNKKIAIADIGTGSGAIAISIAKTLKDRKIIKQVKIFAADISAKTLKIAKINAKNHNCGKNIIFKKGNLLKALPKNAKIDFLLANLPYVGNDYYYKWLKNGGQPADPPAGGHEIKYEPKISLLAKNNGLEYFEKFFPSLPQYLAKSAKIFLESDPYQIKMIKKLAKKYLPKHKITVIKDLRKLNRITAIEID